MVSMVSMVVQSVGLVNGGVVIPRSLLRLDDTYSARAKIACTRASTWWTMVVGSLH